MTVLPRLTPLAALLLAVLLASPLVALPPDTRPNEALTPTDVLVEFARLRGIIDRCTHRDNQIDFATLIETVLRAQGGTPLDALTGRKARLRAQLQAQVNDAYREIAPDGDACYSAGEFTTQTARADALAATLQALAKPN